ncbi:MAG: response regulator transcription factor [Acidimicrobiales bacterium]
MALWDPILAKLVDVAESDAGHARDVELRHESVPGPPADDATDESIVLRSDSRDAQEPVGPLRGATTVLVVEGDETQGAAIRVGLEREGFAVTWVRDGASGLEVLRAISPDIVIVDAILPGFSGIDLTRHIRETFTAVPVIVLSSRSDELDVVLAMEVGADDFLARPYPIRVLVARIRAVLRRSVPRRAEAAGSPPAAAPAVASTATAEPTNPEVLVVDDLQLDPDRHEVFVRGERVELTRQEFRLLEELLRGAGMLLLRRTLLERIWGSDFDGSGKILSTLINRLRARIEDDPENPVRIVTIRGLGYRYEAHHDDHQSSGAQGTGSSSHSSSRPVDYKSMLIRSELRTPAAESSGGWAWD